MSGPDPKHLAPDPAESGAFGPPIDPLVYLEEDWDEAEARRSGNGGNGDHGVDGDGAFGDDLGVPRLTEDEESSRYPTDLLPKLIDIGIVAGCVLFVLAQLGPSNLFSNTTPSGGDMGAHVWGPAYLRDHLLPNLQVSGWTPDWYAGFPAYQFYMVVPSLLIVLLNVGFHGWWGLLPLAAAVGCAQMAYQSWYVSKRRRNAWIAGTAVSLALIGLPYGVAFKLVTVSGPLSLPIAAYLFGRLAGLKFPTPAVFSVASLVFLFYRGFTIYGGNLPSTLAGEFAFAMSLSFGLVYLGVLFRGFETGRHRALAAGLLALTGLCHLIPVFWVLGATVIAVIVRPRRTTDAYARQAAVLAAVGGYFCLMAVPWALDVGLPWPAGTKLFRLDGAFWSGWWTIPFPIVGDKTLPQPVWLGLPLLLAALVLWLAPSLTARFAAPVLVVGGALSAWWVVPFQQRGLYVNDMGWERIPIPNQNPPQTWTQYLLPPDLTQTPGSDLRWVFALALVGVGLSLAARHRVGIYLFSCSVALGLAFWLLPAGRLWNARLLPFYYLTVILLAALAFSEVVRLIAVLFRPPEARGTDGTPVPPLTAAAADRNPTVGVVTALSATALVLIIVGLPLGVLPFKEKAVDAQGGMGYAWPSFSPLQVTSTGGPGSPSNYVKGWANWNYEGYEGKPNYREYYDIVQKMKELGDRPGGCGRAMWEYEKELDRYGTPMALMLLPYWTDGCIGSMEGLYFEASSTTPWHFLMQSELSTAPSSAQRDLPYSGFDINKGVQHMQLLGVRYYMATTDQAVQAARTQPDLTEVAKSGPWVIYEVARSPLVQSLDYEPQVLKDNDGSQHKWLEGTKDAANRDDGPATRWYMNPELWNVMVSVGGPDGWKRIASKDVQPGHPLTGRPVKPAKVSHIRQGREDIEFDVDRVGSPVLVKTSYFPNWQASGADGPWRVAPNLMVVVPTSHHVHLHYGRTSVEWLAYLITVVGLVGLVLLYRRGRYRFERSPSTPVPPPAPLPDAPAA